MNFSQNTSQFDRIIKETQKVAREDDEIVSIKDCEIRYHGVHYKNCDDKCTAIINLLVNDINEPLL